MDNIVITTQCRAKSLVELDVIKVARQPADTGLWGVAISPQLPDAARHYRNHV